MKTLQSILFLAFISVFSILMINSGRVCPQVEEQHNNIWTVIANTQSESASKLNIPEPEQLLPPIGINLSRSIGSHSGIGRGSNTNRNLSVSNRNLSQTRPQNPLHDRIIQSTLQPIDLTISPEEAATYAATLGTLNQ